MDEADFDLSPMSMYGARAAARLALERHGIEADDEACDQVWLGILCGFVSHGGLEPENLRRLQDMVEAAILQLGQAHEQ